MRNQHGDRNSRRGQNREQSRGPSRDQGERFDPNITVGSERGPRSNYGAQEFSRGSSATFPNTGYEAGSRGWDENRSPGSSYEVYDNGDWRTDQEARNWRLDRDMRHQHEHGFFERIGEKVGEFFGKGPKNYKRSDERIREDVSEALYRHPYIDASEIEVQVSEAVVSLSGTVPERAMKRMSEDEAEKVSGVKDVNNSIRVSDSNLSSRSSATPEDSRKDRSNPSPSGKCIQ